MALSDLVKSELKSLQLYYKSLYFLRWFFPQELKNHLNTLEKAQIDTVLDLEAAKLIMSLYTALTAPTWYTSWISYLFSGLHVYLNSALIEALKTLEQPLLWDAENIALILPYPDPKIGVQGLLLLHQTGVVVLNRKAERVDHILRVQELSLAEDVKMSIYKAIATRIGPFNFALAIRDLVRECYAYIPYLLNAHNPGDCATAFNIIFRIAHLPTLPLSDDDNDNADPWVQTAETQAITLKKTILIALQLSTQPLVLARATEKLHTANKLEFMTFHELHDSEAPEQLANLIILFPNLDQRTLEQLEPHRKKIVRIETYQRLRDEQKTNIPYCNNLALWLQQVKTIASPSMIDLYELGYDKCTQPELDRILTVVNLPALWGVEYQPEFGIFLREKIQSGDCVRMELLAVLSQKPQLITSRNRQTILEILNLCSKPAELLQRCTATVGQEVSLDTLYALVDEINHPQIQMYAYTTPKKETHDPSRHQSNGHYANNINNMESGIGTKPALSITTPYDDPPQGNGALSDVLGMVSGALNYVIWKLSPEKKGPDNAGLTADIGVKISTNV